MLGDPPRLQPAGWTGPTVRGRIRGLGPGPLRPLTLFRHHLGTFPED
jgi:hypothetical protein